MGALLGELSDLCRDMTVLAAAPEGGAALLGGLYDRKTLSELTAEVPMRRLLYMTDTIQRTAAALPRSIRQRTDAELCLLRLCDESLSNDTEALADRVSALEDALKKGVVPAERPAARPAAAPTPPPRREVSPIPQETSPAPEPAPVPMAPAPATPVPESAPAAPAAGGDSQVWAALIEHYKGPLTIPDRVWLNQATGTLEGDVLTVSCANDLVKQQLSRKAIEDVLCGVTSRHVGRPVRVQFTVGGGPAAPVRRAPGPRPPRRRTTMSARPCRRRRRPPRRTCRPGRCRLPTGTSWTSWWKTPNSWTIFASNKPTVHAERTGVSHGAHQCYTKSASVLHMGKPMLRIRCPIVYTGKMNRSI